jgi:hypothetical protein
MEHTIQRRTVTSQRLGGLVGSHSIARPSVPLYAVSPRVLPEAVTQTVTPWEQKEFYFDACGKRGCFLVRAGEQFGATTPRHIGTHRAMENFPATRWRQNAPGPWVSEFP